MEFVGEALPLSDADIATAAAQLGIEPALIAAVAQIESRGDGFLPDKRPKILFERHVFSRRTGGIYDQSHPDISGPAGGYGLGGTHQYDRLEEAVQLDRDAALQSASWGRFQVMGFNYEVCGFDDVEAFVQAMMRSEAEHLAAMIAFCTHNDLIDDLSAHDWATFTEGYNGPGQVSHYSALLAQAYEDQVAAWADKEPDQAGRNAGQNRPKPARTGQRRSGDQDFARAIVRVIQQALVAFSGEPLDVDGRVGPVTRKAFDDLAKTAG